MPTARATPTSLDWKPSRHSSTTSGSTHPLHHGSSNNNNTLGLNIASSAPLGPSHPKKKLGKNLNKLVGKPAPPISNSASLASSQHQARSHGLLLLSTQKKQAHHPTESTSTAASSSLLAAANGSAVTMTATTAATSSSLVTKRPLSVNASTHDVLLSVVTGGKEGATAAHAAPLDAWGVAAAAAAAAQASTLGEHSKKEAAEQSRETRGAGGGKTLSHSIPPSGSDSPSTRFFPPKESANQVDVSQETATNKREVMTDLVSLSRWDEFGGRASNPSRGLAVIHDERHHNERSDSRDSALVPAARNREHRIFQERQEVGRQMSTNENVPTPSARKLWEPPNHSQNQPLDNHKKNTAASPNSLHQPQPVLHQSVRDPSSTHEDATPAAYKGPVIHLSSYEDRDRGERHLSQARMLYDPKSGAMVAVKSRHDEPNHTTVSPMAKNNATVTNTNSARKKERAANKKSRKDGGKQDLVPSSSAHLELADHTLVNGSKSKAGNTDRKTATRRKDEGGKDNNNNNTRNGHVSSCKGEIKRTARRLPRTQGVLYARNEKGVIYSADGCEGDLGYGYHSVPGGRSKNPEAYQEFILMHQQENALAGGVAEESYVAVYSSGYESEAYHSEYSRSSGRGLSLKTGFTPEDVQPSQPLEWVKASDKIVLVTGADESPTLKPTAKEWAPSQAALAAAAAALAARREAEMTEASADTDEDEEEAEEDDDDAGSFGLGFDPTQDMDGIIQSPDLEGSDRFASLALDALALEPAVFVGKEESTAKGPSHIFAFGSSGTWADDKASGSDWGAPLSSKIGSIFGSGVYRGEIESKEDGTVGSFLTSTGSWGSPLHLLAPSTSSDPHAGSPGD